MRKESEVIVGYDGLVLYANVNNIFTLRTESANHVALIYQDRPLRSVNGILMWLSPSSPTASSFLGAVCTELGRLAGWRLHF